MEDSEHRKKKLLLTRQYAQMLGDNDVAALKWNEIGELSDKAFRNHVSKLVDGEITQV